jgi:hypothetical protein
VTVSNWRLTMATAFASFPLACVLLTAAPMRRPLGATLLSAGVSAAADTVASAIAAHSSRPDEDIRVRRISISCHSIHSALVMMRG